MSMIFNAKRKILGYKIVFAMVLGICAPFYGFVVHWYLFIGRWDPKFVCLVSGYILTLTFALYNVMYIFIIEYIISVFATKQRCSATLYVFPSNAVCVAQQRCMCCPAGSCENVSLLETKRYNFRIKHPGG